MSHPVALLLRQARNRDEAGGKLPARHGADTSLTVRERQRLGLSEDLCARRSPATPINERGGTACRRRNRCPALCASFAERGCEAVTGVGARSWSPAARQHQHRNHQNRSHPFRIDTSPPRLKRNARAGEATSGGAD